MKLHAKYSWVLLFTFLSFTLFAEPPPHLEQGTDPKTQSSKAQKDIPDLTQAYVSTKPTDLKDGISVGEWSSPGVQDAVKAFIADDKTGKYNKLDSLLIHKDGKLIFEMYNRRGRVDGPHYTMSVTKTMTSVCLARAMQLGLLSVDDLDTTIIDFMPKIDRSKIQKIHVNATRA